MQEAYGLGAERPRAAEDAVQLRRLGLGVLLAAAGRRPAGGRPARAGTRTRPTWSELIARRAGSPPCTSCPRCCRSSWRSRRSSGAPSPAAGDVQRRGAARRACGALLRARARSASCTTSTAPPRPRSTSPAGPCAPDQPALAVPIGRPIANTQIHVLDRALQPGAPRGAPASCTSAASARARLPRPAGADGGAVRARSLRRGSRARGSTGPATWRAGCRTATSSTSAGSTTRSRSAASASSWGRSRRRCAAHPAVREARGAGAEERRRGNAPGRLRGRRDGEDAGRAGAARLPRPSGCPSYMVPSAFVLLERLPLTPNGKLDRRALPAPDVASRSAGAELRGARARRPRSVLAGIWAEVLGVERVGIHDNFFALGGHSLLATQVISRVREAFGVELPLRRFFGRPPSAGLGGGASRRCGRSRRSGVRPPVPGRGRRNSPLSFAQERLWFLDRLEPGSPLYNMPAAVRFTGELDLAALAAAFGEVVRRHEVLRTRWFESADGRPVQSGRAPAPVAAAGRSTCRRSAGWSAGEPSGSVWPSRKAARPFDLARGRSAAHLAAALGRRGARPGADPAPRGRGRLVAGRLPARAGGALRRLGGPALAAAELAVQYADFAVWQRAGCRRGARRAARLLARALAGAPAVLELPTDRPRPAVPSYRGAARTGCRCPPASRAACGRSPGAAGATLFMVLLAGFEALLSRLTGQEDVVVGSPIANRNRLEIEGLIGFFVNTLVLRLDLAGDPTFASCSAAPARPPWAPTPTRTCRSRSWSRSWSRSATSATRPLFQVLFALQNAPCGRMLALPGLTIEPRAGRDRHGQVRPHPDAGARATGGLPAASSTAPTCSTARRWSACWAIRTLLAGDRGGPASPRSRDLPLLTAAEREQVLVGLQPDGAGAPARAAAPRAVPGPGGAHAGRVALVCGRER